MNDHSTNRKAKTKKQNQFTNVVTHLESWFYTFMLDVDFNFS